MRTTRSIVVLLLLMVFATATQAQQVAFGTVTTDRLNVRAEPSLNGAIIARLSRGATYPVAGRDTTAAWWLIGLENGRSGWVSSQFLAVTNVNTVPVITQQPAQPANPVVVHPPATTNASAVVTTQRLNIRSAPTTTATIIARVNRGYSAGVIGRSSDNNWYQILISGGSGWASAAYLSVSNAASVPVTYNTGVPAGQAFATVEAAQLNVRTVPDPVDGVAIRRIFEGETYTIVGRDGTSTWWLLSLPDGQQGWASGAYLTVSAGDSVPVVNNDYVQGTVTAFFLNIRNAPNPYTGRILGQISRGQTYRVVGRTADSSWFQVRLPTGLVGWVRGSFLNVSDPARVPVTG